MLDPINIKYWELAHSPANLGTCKANDYSARCDVCGDSKTNKSKKRLHLYKKTSYENDSVKCFNCDYTSNMYGYLKDNHPHLFNSYKQEIGFNKINDLIGSKPKIIRAVDKKNTLVTFQKPAEFVQIKESDKGIAYITKRGFPLFMNCYYCDSEVILSNGKKVNLKEFIIIPLLENNKWFGFYSRNINSKTFYTYLPEENTGWKVWNWFNINKLEPVYIFEAIFNAKSSGLDNAIAVLGSDLDDARLKELKQPVFVFDNDETGRKKALKYSDKGYKVCVLPKEYTEDINDLYVNGMSMEDISKLIKDNVVSGLKAKIKLKIN